MLYECASEISGVVVYARGAVVTRKVVVPAIADGDADVRVSGLPFVAEAGTVRAHLVAEGRRVVSVQSSTVVPADKALAPVSEQPVIEARAALDRAQAELSELERRRGMLVSMGLNPGLAPRSHGDKIAERTRDAMVAHAVVAGSLEGADARIVLLETRIRKLQLELRAAEVARESHSTKNRRGSGHPERAAIVRLEGSGAVGTLEISYVVPPARWWPLYTLDITGGGTATVLWLEALVAQNSGEDWSGVTLALSTSDLVTDARLPELASLRFGKAQPPRRAGYRPPPAGLDRLFAGYDRAKLSVKVTIRTEATVEVNDQQALSSFDEDDEHLSTGESGAPEDGWDDRTDAGEALEEMMPQGAMRAGDFGGAPPAPEAMKRMSPPAKAPMAAMSPAAPKSAPMRSRGMVGGMQGGGGGAMDRLSESASTTPMEAARADEGIPGDAWLDFDRLRLGGPSSDRRGKLFTARDDNLLLVMESARAIEQVSPGAEVEDPRRSRGHYDHRWDAEGRRHVPSDAQPHRLRITQYDAKPRFRFWTVPRETAEVFREAAIDNPTPGPLLAGPMDVYIDGSLLMTAPIAHVDRGGVVKVGLGVEERLRVARNARVDEDVAGLLGGSTAVDHHVTIDITSGLGQPATIEVYDRLPVTDEKGLEVKVVAEDPPSETYKQEDRGAPIRGGIRWKIALAPGAKRTVKHHYRLVLSAKNEIVGGNRRE